MQLILILSQEHIMLTLYIKTPKKEQEEKVVHLSITDIERTAVRATN